MMKSPVVAVLLLAALVAADALQPIHLSQDSISEPAASQLIGKDKKAAAATATASRSLLDAKVAATDNSHQDAAAAAVTGSATDIKPVEQQQEAAAAANRGGSGRGSFSSGGHYGPSSWGRHLQEDAAPSTPSQGRALLAAELLAAEELMNPSTPAATAAAATAMLERATDGGRYGPSSYMYAGSRPSRYDFGSMWAGGARRLQGSAAGVAAAAEGQERSGREGARGSFGGGGGRFGPSSYFRGRRLASFDAAMAAEMVAAAHHAAPPQMSHSFNGNLKYKTTYGPGYFWDPRSV